MNITNTLPAWVQHTAETVGPLPRGVLRWSGPIAPPAAGSYVYVRINGIGVSRVIAYAEHEGYLGVMTVAVKPPEFLLRNFGGDRKRYEREGALSFGAELRLASSEELATACPDWNVAQREAQVSSAGATDAQCYGTGQTHRGYGWARSPSGAWSARQVELYNRGFEGKPFTEPYTG